MSIICILNWNTIKATQAGNAGRQRKQATQTSNASRQRRQGTQASNAGKQDNGCPHSLRREKARYSEMGIPNTVLQQ